MRQVDIVILSFAKDDNLLKVTNDAITSLSVSEPAQYVNFNIVVIESNKNLKPYTYTGTKTIFPESEFNFNKYLNIGINATESEFICFCNNDLLFHPGWASKIIRQFDSDPALMSASPLCSIFHPAINILPNSGTHYGYSIRKEIAGWCIFTKRELFNRIGLFDEMFKFWFADSDYAKTLQKHNQLHALVTDAIVDHLDGVSTKTLDNKTKLSLTSEQFWYFQYKWEHRNYLLFLYRNFRSKLRIYKRQT